MKNKFLILYLFSFIYSQFDIDFSLESKFAKDSNASFKNPTFFENYLDVNLYLDDLYIFTQLEYSSPPLMGPNQKSLSSLVNMMYVEFFNDQVEMTLGSLYSMYGMGLSLHTYEDQNIDYDNSLYGIQTVYGLSDSYSLFMLAGKRDILSRVSPQETTPSISLKNRVLSIGFNGIGENLNFQYMTMMYEQDYDYDDILSISSLPTILGQYLVDNYLEAMIEYESDYKMKNLEHNIGFNFYSDFFEVVYEKAFVYYHKIYGERVEGYREYLSTYFDLFGFNFIIEHKDYNTPYLYSHFANPPIVSRESNSILSSRNMHTVNFNNEIGHQLEINKTFNTGLNFIFNYAFALHYNANDEPDNFKSLYTYLMESMVGLGNIVNNKNYISNFIDYKPYRQVYVEFSNWVQNEKLYYKVGYDYYHEYFYDKTILAKTYPMQFTYKLNTGSSVTVYFEVQDEIKSDLKHKYYYLSPSYNHFGKFTVTAFYDFEKNGDSWFGVDYTVNLDDVNQLSVFYGSQKGGLVCANGSCVIQPDFEDGLKLTYRTSF